MFFKNDKFYRYYVSKMYLEIITFCKNLIILKYEFKYLEGILKNPQNRHLNKCIGN